MTGNLEDNARTLIQSLTKHFGRVPTDEEVLAFIFGDPERRKEIYGRKGL